MKNHNLNDSFNKAVRTGLLDRSSDIMSYYDVSTAKHGTTEKQDKFIGDPQQKFGNIGRYSIAKREDSINLGTDKNTYQTDYGDKFVEGTDRQGMRGCMSDKMKKEYRKAHFHLSNLNDDGLQAANLYQTQADKTFKPLEAYQPTQLDDKALGYLKGGSIVFGEQLNNKENMKTSYQQQMIKYQI